MEVDSYLPRRAAVSGCRWRCTSTCHGSRRVFYPCSSCSRQCCAAATAAQCGCPLQAAAEGRAGRTHCTTSCCTWASRQLRGIIISSCAERVGSLGVAGVNRCCCCCWVIAMASCCPCWAVFTVLHVSCVVSSLRQVCIMRLWCFGRGRQHMGSLARRLQMNSYMPEG